MSPLFSCILGIGLLAAGGTLFLRGALIAARRARVSPLLAGVVIVGFGTSTPELVVSLDAAARELDGVAVGNAVGSNIANALLILGLVALVRPLSVSRAAIARDAAGMGLATGIFLLLALPGALSRGAGAVLLLGFGSYLVWAVRVEAGRRAPSPAPSELHQTQAEAQAARPPGRFATALALVAGLGLLIIGSRLLVDGAVELAALLELPELVVGLTVVAVGTSLPELTVSLLAALRRQGDVAVGNILGSNLFNLLFVLGSSALVAPLDLPPRLWSLDLPVLAISTVLLLALLFTGRRLSRIEGLALLAGYGVYLALALGSATTPDPF